jgi:hypothetical protein
MKDLTFSAKGTGFVRLNGMDRMLVAILVAFDRDQREFGDRQSKQSSLLGCTPHIVQSGICRLKIVSCGWDKVRAAHY